MMGKTIIYPYSGEQPRTCSGCGEVKVFDYQSSQGKTILVDLATGKSHLPGCPANPLRKKK